MHLGDILKNKKLMVNIVTLFLIGVILLIASNSLFFKGDKIPQVTKPVESTSEVNADAEEYEEQLEKRLAEIFSDMEGAGRVKVLVTLAYSKEIVVAEDGSYDKTVTKETDSAGGSRETESLKTNGTKLILKGTGGDSTPLIIKEIRPKIEGVIIVADGGGNIKVKEQLIKATQTVLGVEPHKVQVLKFKNTK